MTAPTDEQVEIAARAMAAAGAERYKRNEPSWRNAVLATWEQESDEFRAAYIEDARAALVALAEAGDAAPLALGESEEGDA
jgi:hypothetical protein